MLIIGLTGGSGSGKTTVGNLFCEHGAHLIDADVVYHELLEDSEAMKSELKNAFPSAVNPDGTINRRKLASIVFSDDDALSVLNSISHKYIVTETERRLSKLYQQNAECICIDAIALFESGLGNICDATIGVIAPRDTRIERIVSRDEISKEAAEERINAQKPDNYFISNCTYIINNSGDMDSVSDHVSKLYNLIMKGPNKSDE